MFIRAVKLFEHVTFLFLLFVVGVCVDRSQICVLHVRPAGAHAGAGGGARESGSKSEDRNRRVCRVQHDNELIWRTCEHHSERALILLMFDMLLLNCSLNILNLQISTRAKEFKSAVNLLLMVMVHTSIYLVESASWETIYINNSLCAT